MAQRWDETIDAAPQNLAARCVILHAPEGARPGGSAATIPTELADSLARRGIEAEEATGPYSAFAAVCAAVAGGHGDATPPVALIVVEPRAATPGDWLARLAAGLARYAPGAPVWRYERDATPRLRPLEAPMPERDAPSARPAARMRGGGAPVAKPEVVIMPGVAAGFAPGSGATRPARTPALRLSPEPWPDVVADTNAGAADAPSAAEGAGLDLLGGALPEEPKPAPTRLHELVSEEELAMLLADDLPAGPGGEMERRS